MNDEQNDGLPVKSTPLLGEVFTSPCAVVDNNGYHCPEAPFISVEVKKSGKVVQLCKQCYQNALERGEIIPPNAGADLPAVAGKVRRNVGLSSNRKGTMKKIRDLMNAYGLEIRHKDGGEWRDYEDDKIGMRTYMTPKKEQGFVDALIAGETLTLNFWGLPGAEDEIRIRPNAANEPRSEAE